MTTTLIVTGPPAAGKTTLRDALGQDFRQECGEFLDLGVDDVLRSMFAAGDLPDAELAQSGALILRSPGQDVPRAMNSLIERRANHAGPALIEAPLADGWLTDYASRLPAMAANTVVVYVRATLAVRHCRNADRTRDRIGRANLTAMPTHVDGADARVFLERFFGGVIIDTEMAQSEVIALARAVALPYVRAAASRHQHDTPC